MKPKITYAWGLFNERDGELLSGMLARSRSSARGRQKMQPGSRVHRVRITPVHADNGRKR